MVLDVIPPSHRRRGATAVLVKTAITVVTPPVVFHSFPLHVTHVLNRWVSLFALYGTNNRAVDVASVDNVVGA